VIVGVLLVEVTEELVEPVLPWQPGLRLADIAEPPLPDQSGPVTGLLQGRGHGEISRLQGLGGGILLAGISTDAGVAVVKPRHEHAARGRADRGPGVEMGEADPLRRHPVEARGFDDLLPVTAEITPAEVVSHDPDEIRAGFRGTGSTTEDTQGHGQENKEAVHGFCQGVEPPRWMWRERAVESALKIFGALSARLVVSWGSFFRL